MYKTIKRLIAGFLAVLMCLLVAGCGSGEALVEMDYKTGTDGMGRYNATLYGNNGLSDVGGADPGVFYVSEEEDPEYGGYFYRYHTSFTSSVPETEYYTEEGIQILVAYCDRSKDLFHWESAGALPGSYALGIREFDWCNDYFWAPEVIRNPENGRYYMYFSAAARQNLGFDHISNDEMYRDRLYIGVAVADTPAGPFQLIGEVDEKTGYTLPTINFQVAYDLEHNMPAIDAHPYFDDNGEFYLYFVRHSSTYYGGGNRLAGMKMKSMAYPDYSTATILALPGNSAVTATAGDLIDYQAGEDYFIDEGGVNEGPFMYKHNGKYYMTYSAYGFDNPGYSVHQAVGDSPLGPFRKLTKEEGNPVLDGSMFGDVNGTGHHSLVTVGDELWIVYQHHSSVNHGVGWDRPTAVDRITWVTNADGLEVMTGNGPSRILTWLPESISGYQNLASSAMVSIDNGTGAQYLTDEAYNLYEVTKDYCLSADSGDVTITLSWAEPVSITSIMVYNSAAPESAFSQISDIRVKLAEKPSWASKDYDWAVMQNIPLQVGAWDSSSRSYLECAPAVAEFEPVMVTEIQITIKEADRLMEYDRLGQKITALDVAEIVVLGKEA